MQGVVIQRENSRGRWIFMIRLLSPFSGLGVLFSRVSTELANTNFNCTEANQEKFSFPVEWGTFWLADMQPKQVCLNICCLKANTEIFFFILILLNKLPFLGALGNKTMKLLAASKTYSADWLHLDVHGYLCLYKVSAFWGIIWVMVLVTVGKHYSYNDHQNKSIHGNRRRVVTLFFEKWAFVHQQKNQVPKLHGCQRADIFVTAYHNLDVNFWHKDGCN